MVEFKLSDFFSPARILLTYLRLRRSERWSHSQIEKYQSKRLARLLRFCAGDVPYYGPVFREAGLDPANIFPMNARRCLEKLPNLDKSTLKENPDLFMARDATRFRPKPVMTSGTTGTPLTLYWDRGSNVMELCSIQRFWRWVGFRAGHPFLDLRSRIFSDNENHLVKADGIVYIYNWKARVLEFSSDLIERNNIRKYNEILRRYRPTLVRGHAQAIQKLANLLREVGSLGWRPKFVTTNAEALYYFQRQEIEQAWGVRVLDCYGLKEHNVFIAQCREGTYHMFPEYGICEILNDDGKPVSPGQEGWIIATGLHNYAQPLLRYNTRDRAVAGKNQQCPCGRTLPAVERIIGRIDDCLYTAEGKRFSGMSFAFFGRRGIKKARLVQEDIHTVTVELVATAEFDEAERTALLGALERKVEHKLSFVFKLVNDIVQETLGKFRFVVSRLNVPRGSGGPPY